MADSLKGQKGLALSCVTQRTQYNFRTAAFLLQKYLTYIKTASGGGESATRVKNSPSVHCFMRLNLSAFRFSPWMRSHLYPYVLFQITLSLLVVSSSPPPLGRQISSQNFPNSVLLNGAQYWAIALNVDKTEPFCASRILHQSSEHCSPSGPLETGTLFCEVS